MPSNELLDKANILPLNKNKGTLEVPLFLLITFCYFVCLVSF